MRLEHVVKTVMVGMVCVIIYIVHTSEKTLPFRHRWKSTSTSLSQAGQQTITVTQTTSSAVTNTNTIVLQNSNSKKCQPKKNVFMLKTHKTGSSTLQNILHRYADKHNLTLVLPKFSTIFLGYPERFSRDVVIEVPWNEYNIFAQHSRLDITEVQKLMPNNTIYITILREPATQFESLFNYLGLGNDLKITGKDKLKQFLMNPNKYVPSNPTPFVEYYIKNGNFFDFGFDPKDISTEEKLSQVIQTIDQTFHLVLIAEYFDESLILLKDLMCWDLDSVVYFSMNARKQSSVPSMSDSMRDKNFEWNSADVRLYRHFNETFWKGVKLFGEPRMEEEIWALKERKQKYWDMCVGDIAINGEGVWAEPGLKITSYILKESAKNITECEQMTKPEIPFTKELVHKLKKRIESFRHNSITKGE